MTSYFKLHPKAWDIPVLLLLAITTLAMGLYLPIITLHELVFWKTTFSVLTGIASLVAEKHFSLAIIIFVFSFVFPIVKLFLLMVIWFGKLAEEVRENYLHWLGIMGKWSMLDVFVVAVTIVISKISGLASAKAEVGIYFFAFSVLLSMIIAMRMESFLKIHKV